MVGGFVLYLTRSSSEVVWVATPLPFTLFSWHPAAFAAGATSKTFCSGKLPPSGNTSAAWASLPPPPPPPATTTATHDHAASARAPPIP